MSPSLWTALTALGIGFGAAALLTPVAIWMAKRNGAVARPVADRWSRREVPVLGGTAIFAAFLIAFLLTGTLALHTIGILAGATLLFLLGLVDDLRRLRPATKLVGQIVAATILIICGVQARFVDNQLLTIPLTIIWVVGVTNAFNLIDNMDGLCAGVGTIAAVALGAYALRYDVEPFPQVVSLVFALAGAQAGFLLYNVNPAKTFMGDSGALVIGFVLSAAAILGTFEHAGNLFMILAVPVFVLAVPIFDTTFVTVMRKFNRRKVSEGGKDHLSHRLVAVGMSEGRAVLVLWSICAVLAGLGVAASYLDLFANLVLMGVSVIGVVIFAIFLGEVAIYRTATDEPEGAAGEEMRRTFLNYVRGTSLVLLDLVLICLAYLASYLIFFEGRIPGEDHARLLESLPVVIISQSVFFYGFRLYRSFWRYFGVGDLLSVLKAVVFGSMTAVLLVVIFFRFRHYSRAVFMIDAMLLFLLISGTRFLFRALRESRSATVGKRVVIVGAGDRGELCMRSLKTREEGDYHAVAFLDPDPALRSRKILGVPVLGTLEELERAVGATRAEEVVMAMRLPEKDLDDLRRRCDELGLPLYLAPASQEFIRL
jgi:UDP-GlcNAc:undecaprenyl-phosphate/decaprenyl-phosphate GlcNAc-1-phosphate transferase